MWFCLKEILIQKMKNLLMSNGRSNSTDRSENNLSNVLLQGSATSKGRQYARLGIQVFEIKIILFFSDYCRDSQLTDFINQLWLPKTDLSNLSIQPCSGTTLTVPLFPCFCGRLGWSCCPWAMCLIVMQQGRL